MAAVCDVFYKINHDCSSNEINHDRGSNKIIYSHISSFLNKQIIPKNIFNDYIPLQKKLISDNGSSQLLNYIVDRKTIFLKEINVERLSRLIAQLVAKEKISVDEAIAANGQMTLPANAGWYLVKDKLSQPIARETLEKCRTVFAAGVSNVPKVPIDFSSKYSLSDRKIVRIQVSRMSGSNTIRRDASSIQRWLFADESVRKNAMDPSHLPNLEWICEINRMLGLDGGGHIREGGIERVYAGGRNAYEYAPPECVKEEMNQFVAWFQNAIKQCDEGKRNPIEVAARAYQYLVSIHPFCDQNGRTTRLVMDYVLLKYKLPPASMENNICVAIFSRAHSGQNPTKATESVLQGILRSYEYWFDDNLTDDSC